MAEKILLTSESVTEGHPDKMSDKISDAILDAILEQDPDARVACETSAKNGGVNVFGEITTKAYVDIPSVVRETIKEIGYTKSEYGIEYETCSVWTQITEQSPDIALGVNETTSQTKEQGAGDQGMMFGFACNETPELMPLTISLAHKLCMKLAEVRKSNELTFLRPDGKSQVTVEYDKNGKPLRVDAVVVSTQHDENIPYKELQQKIIEKIIKPVCKEWIDSETKFFVNPTGAFVRGGPYADAGLTGRKIIVDTYGGIGRHGGGAFCVEGNSLVNTAKGLELIKEMKETVDNHLLVKTDVHPEPAKEWYDNGVMETLVVRSEDGYSLEGSNNQAVRVIDNNGNYIWKRMDQLKKGDSVAIHKSNRLFGERVDLSDFTYTYKESTAEARKNKFSFPKELTEDYAYLLGSLIGDGNCMMEGAIAICVCEKEQKENLGNLYKKLFGNKWKIFGHWAYVAGVELRAYLKHIGLDYRRSWEKSVPEKIFKAPKKVVAAFIRGLFDTDGGIRIHGRNKNFPDIKLVSSSYTLIQQIQQLLLSFGIISRIQKTDKIGTVFRIKDREATTRRIIYALRIKGAESVRIFKEEIGFGLPRKQKILDNLKLKEKRNLFVVPRQQKRIKSLWQKLSLEDHQLDKAKIGRFTRSKKGKTTKELTCQKLREFLEIYRNKLGEEKEFKELELLCKMNHYYSGVEEIENSLTHVYDLLVPKSHTFTANGFVCHNSGKDPSKVDRSAAYMARYIAKNIVASGLADKCEIQLAYAIGHPDPVSLHVDTFGSGKISEEKICELVRKIFPLKPAGILKHLNLKRPIYKKTAAYGHFGRDDPDFTWEKTDKAEVLKKEAGI